MSPKRVLPMIDKDNVDYWTGGAAGELRILRCQDCGYYVHPPVRFCPRCEGRRVSAHIVSGRGCIASFTVVHKAWVPGLATPFVLALIALAEQADVQLVSNIINCDPETVRMGQQVRVTFEQVEDVWIPFFEPDTE